MCRGLRIEDTQERYQRYWRGKAARKIEEEGLKGEGVGHQQHEDIQVTGEDRKEKKKDAYWADMMRTRF